MIGIFIITNYAKYKNSPNFVHSYGNCRYNLFRAQSIVKELLLDTWVHKLTSDFSNDCVQPLVPSHRWAAATGCEAYHLSVNHIYLPIYLISATDRPVKIYEIPQSPLSRSSAAWPGYLLPGPVVREQSPYYSDCAVEQLQVPLETKIWFGPCKNVTSLSTSTELCSVSHSNYKISWDDPCQG